MSGISHQAIEATTLSSLDVPRAILVEAAAFSSIGTLLDGRAEAGVYVLLHEEADGERRYYVGASGRDVVKRVRSHLRPDATDITSVCVIVGRRTPLTKDASFALERIVHQTLDEAGEHLVGGQPHGGGVSPDHYRLIRVTAGLLALDLARLGMVSPHSGLRTLIAGPLGHRPGLDGRKHPDFARVTLEIDGITATAVIDENGWPHLQPGSQIRLCCSPKMARVTHLMRLEAVWGGAVTPNGIVEAPMAFSSWSTLSRFVLGAQAGGPGQWKHADGTPCTTENTVILRAAIDARTHERPRRGQNDRGPGRPIRSLDTDRTTMPDEDVPADRKGHHHD